MDYQKIIDKYYPDDNALRHILITHSQSVAQKALQIVFSHPALHLDQDFVLEAAMLHDIGIFKTDAPGISCHGTEPYIRHGILGASILRAEGYERHARVCERHTGTGLPGFEPETLEEEIICYADKFYSKSQPEKVRTVLETAQSLEKFGHEGVKKFLAWSERFE